MRYVDRLVLTKRFGHVAAVDGLTFAVRIFATRPDPELLGPWAGLGVMTGSAGALPASASAGFRRRDV